MIVIDPQRIADHRSTKITSERIDLGDRNDPAVNVRAIRFDDAESVAAEPNDFGDWLRRQVSVTTERIDRSQRIDRRLRDLACLQATVCWDSDRQIEVEQIGANLADNPTEVIAVLRATPQGCEWLMKRWAMLAYVAESKKDWTVEQIQLASQMLGTPVEFQNQTNPLGMIRLDGKPIQNASDLAALARREIKQLRELREYVAPLDESAKLLARKDEIAVDAESPELRRLGRSEQTLYLRLRWLVRQIEEKPTFARSVPQLPEVVVAPVEETPPASVPDDPEPPAEVEKRPAPTFPADRNEARLKKAEVRREAEARKLERRRA